MLLSSQKMLFGFLLITGTVLALSSNSWLMAWIGLELNLMSFIPILTSGKDKFSCEAALKYFLIQAIGSALIIFAAPISINSEMFYSTILFALILKLGASPFHFWLPAVMEGLNWIQAIILMTVQKLAPMFLICHIVTNPLISYIMILCAMLSAMIGSVGGLNQTSLRKMLAFSSLNHIGWMLTALTISESSWLIYFLFYCVVSVSICLLFNFQQTFFLPQLFMNKNLNPYTNLVNSFSLLSLGGLPPFTGFIPKWVMIESMTMAKMFIPALILIASSLITLYFYLRMAVSYLLLISFKTKLSLNFTPNASSLSPMFISVNLFMLLVPSIFILV
uniref:NADH-ubiquinone oxidoreductase chain 2 n=1 Tax=Panulirus penicillatus TaxID=150433 RepID=A0A7G9M8L5_PANPE|nr:NADH dehydrogenase subunit 2 [Panulirus penicillatus]QNN01852.1 NADH dehydrogenase subunit 2 [Panulirus penicillatus]